MAKQSKAQKETIGRVMGEFKRGELSIGANGPAVTSPKQAIAVALREAGSTDTRTPAENRTALRRTKRSERRASEEQADDGRPGVRSGDVAPSDHATHASLYAEARRRGLPGRSTMRKADLEAALR